MALDLGAALAQQLLALRSAGVRAVADPRDVNPPCLLVMPPAIVWRMKCADASWSAYAIATDPGTEPALRQLSVLLELARSALGAGLTGAEPADVTLPDGSGVVPGYALTWTTRIPT